MRDTTKEIIKLTSRELILSLFDVVTPFFEADRIYRQSIRKYKSKRGVEKSKFWEKINYLKRRGYIESVVEQKERYFELTPKGYKYAESHCLSNIKIAKPEIWDKKWRIVIFDIPEKMKACRNILRRTIQSLGFEAVQKSVYIFPFQCTDEILFISERVGVKEHVLITISDIIQGEERLIEKFIDKGILDLSEIK